MTGIAAYGAYLPHWRLPRDEIASFLGGRAGSGTRSVAGYDEDTTSLGVEAARRLPATDAGPDVVYFATAHPAYAEKSNATVLHAALGLDAGVGSFDLGPTARSAAGAIDAGVDAAIAGRRALVVLADVRGGRPGGADERDGGDAAAAFLLGGDDGVAAVAGRASLSSEFLDAWRDARDTQVSHWEERFTEAAYLPLVEQAVAGALDDAGCVSADVRYAAVAGPSARVIRKAGALVPGDPEIAERLLTSVGNTGAAHGGLALASILDVAEPGDLIASVSLADGIDVTLWRATERLRHDRPADAISDWVARDGAPLSYASFLTWRGLLDREGPRRPDPERPAAPPSRRSVDWKFALVATRCQRCGTRQLPPQRVCSHCGAVDAIERERVADVRGTIRTFAVDRLAYSIAPPVVAAVIDLDGGGRMQCELTDVDPQAVRIGDRVELTFRRTHTAGGVHNYFWKARPVGDGGEEQR